MQFSVLLPFSISCLLQKERICFCMNKYFSLNRVDPMLKGIRSQGKQAGSHKGVPLLKKLVGKMDLQLYSLTICMHVMVVVHAVLGHKVPINYDFISLSHLLLLDAHVPIAFIKRPIFVTMFPSRRLQAPRL